MYIYVYPVLHTLHYVYLTRSMMSLIDDSIISSYYNSFRLNTVWGMKLNFALRTALAALLASCYAMQPAVHRAEWENATVFAPVLAVP